MLGSYKYNRKQIFLVDYLYVMDKDEVQLDERLDIHHYINSSNDYLKMGEKLGLLYLESILEENKYSVTIYKVVNKKDEDCFIRLLKENNAKMVGFSLTYDNVTNINRFCDRLKRIYPDIHITVGGPYVSTVPEEYLLDNEQIDSVMCGEGEATILELVDRLINGKTLSGCKGIVYRSGVDIITEKPRSCIENLDKLPFPKRNIEKPIHTRICTSRGCIGSCSFCDVKKLWKKWRGRTPINIVNEMEMLYKTLGITSFDFVDSSMEDPGAQGKKRLYELANELKKRNIDVDWGGQIRAESFNMEDKELLSFLYDNGLERVFIGVESFSQHLLDIFHKRAKIEDNYRCIYFMRDEMKLAIDMGFIMFTPYTTIDDLILNIDGLNHTNMAWNSGYLASRLWLFHGTDIFHQIKADGLLEQDYSYKNLFKYKFEVESMKELSISLQELSRADISVLSSEVIAMDKILVHMRRKYKYHEKIINKIETQEKQLNEIKLVLTKNNVDFFSKCIELLGTQWNETYFQLLMKEYFNSDIFNKYIESVKNMSRILFMHIRRQGCKIDERWI